MGSSARPLAQAGKSQIGTSLTIPQTRQSTIPAPKAPRHSHPPHHPTPPEKASEAMAHHHPSPQTHSPTRLHPLSLNTPLDKPRQPPLTGGGSDA
jgi:hypothetical protein